MIETKVAVIGLGVVGLVSALRLCEKGHRVIGIDQSDDLKNRLREGELAFYEPDLEPILQKHIHKQLTLGHYTDIEAVDVVIVCVGTPIRENGKIDLSYLRAAVSEIKKGKVKSIVLRSTVPPGTTESFFEDELKSWPLVYCPEFLRQGQAWKDSQKPSLKIYATLGTEGEWFESLFSGGGTWNKVGVKTAEYIKYMNNSFHALKVVFANEMGALGAGLGVDMEECYHLFTSDRTLNISEKYLRPGAPYGGACLSKDLAAVSELMEKKAISAPLIKAIEISNQSHHNRILNQLEMEPGVCGFVGLWSRKPGDFRKDSIFALAGRVRDGRAWFPNISSLDIAPLQLVNSFDELLKVSSKLVIAMPEIDDNFWEKIISSGIKVFVFDLEQVPMNFRREFKFHVLMGKA